MMFSTLFLSTLLSASSPTDSPDGGTADTDATGATPATIDRFDPRWSRVSKPTPGPPRVIGQPGAGCVQGAKRLPLRARGFLVAHPERRRHFGHPSLISFLRKLASQARRKKLRPIVVGDLGQPAGGPTPTGHRSHQSGLDVDLWYAPPPESWSPGEIPAPDAPSVVNMRTKKLLPAWRPRVARLVELVASDPAVVRVFVHPAIKRALCRDEDRRGPWLRTVRPWWGHQDHLHARLRCPNDSPDCVEQKPLPPGDGCDASLDWWFSEDAAKTVAKRKPPGQGAPAMPDKCEALLAR